MVSRGEPSTNLCCPKSKGYSLLLPSLALWFFLHVHTTFSFRKSKHFLNTFLSSKTWTQIFRYSHDTKLCFRWVLLFSLLAYSTFDSLALFLICIVWSIFSLCCFFSNRKAKLEYVEIQGRFCKAVQYFWHLKSFWDYIISFIFLTSV